MNAAFQKVDVRLEGSALRVRFEIVNHSTEAWHPKDGWAASYHLFDEPTGTLVERIRALQSRASRVQRAS